MKKKKMLRALKVLKTWARYDLDAGYRRALTPVDVIELIDRALKGKE